PGATDPDFDGTDAVITRHISGVGCGLLRGEWSAFARSAESQRTGTLPGEHIPGRVGDRNNRVVERGLNMDNPEWNVFAFLLLEGLLLAFFLRCGRAARCCCWFCHGQFSVLCCQVPSTCQFKREPATGD